VGQVLRSRSGGSTVSSEKRSVRFRKASLWWTGKIQGNSCNDPVRGRIVNSGLALWHRIAHINNVRIARIMSTIKSMPRRVKSADPELAAKICELRSSLGLLQSELADKLKVTRSQIGKWERGVEEKPSNEKLLEIARLSPSREGRLWFLRRAGVDLNMLKADLLEDAAAQFKTLAPEQTIEMAIQKSLAKDFRGRLTHSESGSIRLPRSLFSRPELIVCLEVSKRPPWHMSERDLILVNRGVSEIGALWRRLTAVFFNRFPISFETYTSHVDPTNAPIAPNSQVLEIEDSSALHHEIRERWPERGFSHELEKRRVQHLEEITEAGFLVGWFQILTGHGQIEQISGDRQSPPWCIGLRVHSPMSRYTPSIKISEWRLGPIPDLAATNQAPRLLEGIEIVGQAVGWLSQSG
jgi:transcriptional regulator with XRE-family HTH domain